VTPKNSKTLIVIVSIVVPILIGILFKVQITGYDFSFLPPIYASINGLTAVFLLVALWAIKNKKRQLHENLMKLCMVFSLIFLTTYVAYHMTSAPTPYGGSGVLKTFYLVILISHILLSVIIIPLVLFSYLRAILGNFEGHKALVKYAFPAWLYVAISGVIVYLMISPYY
jgi:putative membrane protein